MYNHIVAKASGRNQLANVHNRFQNQDLYKRVLVVCSAGLLRSATVASVLHTTYGYNVRNCGTSQEYALIPISEALIEWADHIVFVSPENFYTVSGYLERYYPEKPVTVYDIGDNYSYNSPELVKIIKEIAKPLFNEAE